MFTHIDNNLEYPLLMNLFQIFHKILNFNQEWLHLELLSEHLLHRYDEMLRQLKTKEQQQGKVNFINFKISNITLNFRNFSIITVNH